MQQPAPPPGHFILCLYVCVNVWVRVSVISTCRPQQHCEVNGKKMLFKVLLCFCLLHVIVSAKQSVSIFVFSIFLCFWRYFTWFSFCQKGVQKMFAWTKNVFLKFFVGLHENQYDIRSGYSSDRSIFLVIVNWTFWNDTINLISVDFKEFLRSQVVAWDHC
jgi:hypothetical protein